MEQSPQNRTIKYLSLLKQAQNTAFINLVVENLKVELEAKPWRLLRVISFLSNELPQCQCEFTRLKVCEGLIPIIGQILTKVHREKFIQNIESQLNQEDQRLREKAINKLQSSILCIDLQDQKYLQSNRSILSFLNINDLTKVKDFFFDLINYYEPLLAAESCNEPEPVSGQSKDVIKQMFMGSVAKYKTDKLKLSDFIDESLFDEIEGNSKHEPLSATNKDKQKKPLSDLLDQLQENELKQILELPNLNKRQKTTQKQSYIPRYVIMSPLLGLLLHFTQKMLATQWQLRQIAACIIKSIISAQQLNLDYYIIAQEYDSNKLVVSQSNTVCKVKICQNILPYLVIFILMDRFNDYEELKVLTPSREEGLQLFVKLQQLKEIEQDFSQLIQYLPIILKAVENDTWTGGYNFFLILKGLLPKHTVQVYKMFNRVLIESLPKVEEEVKIIVNELIEQLLPLYLQDDDSQKILQALLNNLQDNLNQSDDIDCFAISVFSLMQKVLEQTESLKKIEFNLQLEIFYPFNFHKVGNVRYSYNQIINKCLQLFKFNTEQLQILATLTIQSLVMERTKHLVKVLFANLRLIVNKFPQEEFLIQIGTLFQDGLIEWLYPHQIVQFDNFLFFESQKFEAINRDYYKIVYKPTTYDEIDTFYQNKTQNLTKAISLLMLNSNQAVSEVVKIMESTLYIQDTEQQPLREGHLFLLLVINYYLKQSQQNCQIDIDYLNNFTTSMLQSDEESISIHNFPQLIDLQTNIQILEWQIDKYQIQQGSKLIVSLKQLLEQCLQNLRLVNLGVIQQQNELLFSEISQYKQYEDAQECLNCVNQLFTSLFNYATRTINQIKGIAAVIQVQLMTFGKILICNQLNCIIKPLLTESKNSQKKFVQKLSSSYLVDLTQMLFQMNRCKAGQQILSVIVKNLEQSGQDQISDLGCKHIINRMIVLNDNIFNSFNGYFQEFISQNVTLQNCEQMIKAFYFILQRLNAKNKNLEQYDEQAEIMQKQISVCINFNSQTQELASLVQLFFYTFNKQQIPLISTLVQMLEKRSKIAFESLIKLLENQNPDIMKFIPVFIIPVIKNIQYSRQIFNNDKQITQILAQLLQLLPLNLIALSDLTVGKQSQQAMELKALAQEGYDFLQVFVNNQMIVEYKLSIPVKAVLRDYQKSGITWIASLGKYNLNCALCDDMGLGKTLQSLCVILNETYLRQQLQKEKLPNLIVCPTSITHNWNNEIQKFFTGFKSIVYEGDSAQKTKIIQNSKDYDVIIVSYEKLRSQLKAFQNVNYFYLVLDEAHIIKNSKSKVSQAVKQLNCEKKLVLTGTPLQNRVSEIWSIFDFILPGFLEEEKTFNKKYNQYLTSNLKQLAEKLEETQSFLDALKSLKKRISPFILRRTKQDVLKELPPKIIQDYPCQMTSFQQYVYSLIEKICPLQKIVEQSQDNKTQQQKSGKQTLKNLILHRQVCNHPVFAIHEFQKDKNIQKHLKSKSEQDLRTYENSGKLQGLIELLMECEIIEPKNLECKEEQKTSHQQDQENQQSGSLLFDMAIQAQEKENIKQGNHRILLFCQMKSFMNMIATEILDKFGIKYLQLLSSHQGKQRIDICNQFNNDETIQVLLLTTAVGGLGLNLTGADTVIFAEHDWNPQKDLQAIDRAHRIGQTKTVNVYRLIVNNTIEEKIMSLQNFKKNLANSLVQSQGVSSEDAKSLEMGDIIKSFEEHSAYQNSIKQGPVQEDKMITNLEEIWKGGNYEDL